MAASPRLAPRRRAWTIAHLPVAAVAAVVTVWAQSGLFAGGIGELLAIGPWLAAVALWAFGAVAVALSPGGESKRWLLVGPLLAIALIVPGDRAWWRQLRLNASWPALERLADHPPATGNGPGRVGLFSVSGYQRFDGGFRFVTQREFFGSAGLAYCDACRLPASADDTYTRLRGNWYRWVRGFD